jgi:hypothetical protein
MGLGLGLSLLAGFFLCLGLFLCWIRSSKSVHDDIKEFPCLVCAKFTGCG